MDGAGLTAIAVVRFSGPSGEDTVLEEERLVSGHALFKEVGLLRFFLSPEALLVEEGVELPFCLSRDVVVEKLIPVRDVFLQFHFTRVNLSRESRMTIITDNVTLTIRLLKGVQEDPRKVGLDNYTSALAAGPFVSQSDLLCVS